MRRSSWQPVSGTAALLVFVPLLLLGCSSDDTPTTAPRACEEFANCRDFGVYSHMVSRHELAAPPTAIACAGSLAYVITNSDEQSLVILDYASPSSPVPLSELAIAPNCRGIAIGGDIACLVAQGAGLVVVDIADPAAPVIVGSSPLPFNPLAVELLGTTAFVLGTSDLALYDLQQPAAPAQLAHLTDVGGRALVPSEDGSRLFVAGQTEGLLTIDISDLERPVLASREFPLQSTIDVQIAGSTLFASDLSGGIIVYDISGGTVPRLVDFQHRDFGVPVAISGDWVGYAAPMGVSSFEDLIVGRWNASGGITPLGRMPIRGTIADLAVIGDCVFVLRADYGEWAICALTISPLGAAAPDREGESPFGGTFAAGLSLTDDTALVIGASSLQIIDTSCVAEPVPRQVLSHTPFPLAMDRRGDRIGVTTGQGRLSILVLNDAGIPPVIGDLALPAIASAIAMSATHAYLGSDQAIYVVRLGAGPDAYVSGTIVQPVRALLLLDHALAVAGPDGLSLYSLTDPDAPMILAQVQPIAGSQVQDMCVVGTSLALACDNQVVLVDVSDPGSPQVTAQPSFAERIIDLCEGDGLLYVVEEGVGLHIIDPLAPSGPSLVGLLDAAHNITGVVPLQGSLWMNLEGLFAVAPVPCESGQ